MIECEAAGLDTWGTRWCYSQQYKIPDRNTELCLQGKLLQSLFLRWSLFHAPQLLVRIIHNLSDHIHNYIATRIMSIRTYLILPFSSKKMGRNRAAVMIIIQLGSKSPTIVNESPQDLHFPVISSHTSTNLCIEISHHAWHQQPPWRQHGNIMWF